MRYQTNYYVEVDRHWYSVPFQLVGQRCEVRLTTRTVEIIFRGRRVVSHLHSYQPGRITSRVARWRGRLLKEV